jgi:hypothetical protein
LGAQQAIDGAALSSSDTTENRIWGTSYAIPAALGKQWSEIMQSVSKPADQVSSNNPLTTDLPTSNTQTDSVICSPGDLFSVTTGQSCSTTILANPISQFPVNPETPKKQKHILVLSKNNPDNKTENSSDLPMDTPKDIVSNALTATAGGALPLSKSAQNIPIILGTLSGLILLYAATKFWILK